MQSNMRRAQQQQQPVRRTQVLTQGSVRRNRNRNQQQQQQQTGSRGTTNRNNVALRTNQQQVTLQGVPVEQPASTGSFTLQERAPPAVVTAASVPEVTPVPPPAPTGPPFTVDMSPKAAQLSPSILLMGYFDWQIIPDSNGKPWSRCLDMVWRARRLARGNKLNFVPTHHWIPGSEGFGIDHFCYMYKDADDKMVCGDWDQTKIDEFERSMTICFTEAFRNGFTPYLRPHLDDGYVRGIWRNGLLFSPIIQYGTYTYKQIMLDPLAKALAGALRTVAAEGTLWPMPNLERPRVYVALQGEMSATMMRYTRDWASTIPDLRRMIGTTLADVKVGVGLNFNALDQTEYSVAPNTGLGWMFGSGSRASRYPVPSIDGAALNNLVNNEIDFIGISAYAPYSGPGMLLNEFENSAFNVGDSLRTLGNGIDLASLVNSGKLELHYSEFGIGGGNEGNAAPAVSARMVGKQPWAGVAGFYSPSTDPWQIPSLQAYRTEFYSRTLDWLANPTIKTYMICDVFVWGMASWDLFGVYPDSSTAQGTYRDANMVKQIARHNIKVIAAQTLASKGPEFAAMEYKRLEEQEAQLGNFYSQEPQPYARMPTSSSSVQQEARQAAAAPPPRAETRQNRNNNFWGGFFG